jgi:hypothetical protein
MATAGSVTGQPVNKALTEVTKGQQVKKTRFNVAFNPTTSGGPNTTGVGQIFPTGRV